MLLLLMFMGLMWCLTLWESEMREPKWGSKGAVLLSLTAGLLIGLGGLTRYSFLSLLVPVAVFMIVFGGPRRWVYCICAIVVAVAVVSPWIARNYAVSGKAFGTTGYNVVEWFFPGFRLQRSLQPELPPFAVTSYFRKLIANLLPALQNDLFDNTGGWITGFFMAGLLVGFRNPALRRLRYFTFGSIFVLAISQSLARTKLSEETADINSENGGPLNGAASLGAEDVGIRLLAAGARADLLGRFGETALHWAAYLGASRLVDRLIQLALERHQEKQRLKTSAV